MAHDNSNVTRFEQRTGNRMTINAQAKTWLSKFHRIANLFRTDDQYAGLATLDVFLLIVESNGRIHNGDLLKRSGLTKSHLSLITSQLSPYGRGDKPGLGLIDLIDDVSDRRYKIVILTTKGNALASEIEGIILK